MTLIALLIALILQTFFNVHDTLQRFNLFDRYIDSMKPTLAKVGVSRAWLAIIMVELPILILIAILTVIFHYVPLLYLIFAVVVLLFCMNARDFKLQLSDYFAAMINNNIEKTQIEASKFVSYPLPEDKAEIARSVTQEIFIRAQTDIFSVIFWFIVLGPFGAVLYHLTALIYDRSEKGELGLSEHLNSIATLKNILDWLPIRLVAFTYGLIGHFGPVINLWVEHLAGGLGEGRQFIVNAGLTALNINILDPLHSDVSENYQAIGLVTRALWTWMIVLAVLDVTAWLF